MLLRRSSPMRSATLAFLVMNLLLAAAPAQTETVLYSFTGKPDGYWPYAGVVLDAKGDLYGTTYAGGPHGHGTVFKVTRTGKERKLYTFTGGLDGSEPVAGLIRDNKSNLYGTTELGGLGYGTVFKIAPSGVETVLYTFTGKADGAWPEAGLVLDAKGNLYGTTLSGGGDSDSGTVFKLTPSGKKTVLYSFTGKSDGGYPKGTVIRDSRGNLYGTTFYGGGCSYYCGVVFKVTPSGKETTLHSFNGADGSSPTAGVIRDAKGNLYGTTEEGGRFNAGTVFKLTPSGAETILYSFGEQADGENPIGGVVLDAQGNLYGTTLTNNHFSGYGTVFEVTPSGEEKVLHTFTGGTDGNGPIAGLTVDPNGNLYGTTVQGGSSSYGTVFKVSP